MAFAMSLANRNNEKHVFDWEKAARIICEKKPEYAEAGLKEDLEWTQGEIYKDGVPVMEGNGQMWLASTRATPILILPDEYIECWKMQSEVLNWGPRTIWPEEAMKILSEGGVI